MLAEKQNTTLRILSSDLIKSIQTSKVSCHDQFQKKMTHNTRLCLHKHSTYFSILSLTVLPVKIKQ